MRQITNTSQLLPEDRGTVIEVLQERNIGGKNPTYVWQRGVLIEVADTPGRRKEIILALNFSHRYLAKDNLYTTRGTNSLPNRTPGESQGIQDLLGPEDVIKYASLLKEIEPERPLTTKELERLEI